MPLLFDFLLFLDFFDLLADVGFEVTVGLAVLSNFELFFDLGCLIFALFLLLDSTPFPGRSKMFFDLLPFMLLDHDVGSKVVVGYEVGCCVGRCVGKVIDLLVEYFLLLPFFESFFDLEDL